MYNLEKAKIMKSKGSQRVKVELTRSMPKPAVVFWLEP